MAATTIPFPGSRDNAIYSEPLLYQGVNLVYTRASWADEWELNPWIEPEEVTWSVSPTLPVAVLRARYGQVMLPSTPTFEHVTRASITDLIGSFVKISCGTQTSEDGATLDRKWYGVISEAHDEQGGTSRVNGLSYGMVTLVCYGMEKLLSDHVILDAVCLNIDDELTVTGVPIDFNHQGPRGAIGNRSAAKFAGTYAFAAKASESATWSSKDILEYLIANETPTNYLGIRQLMFRLDLPDGIPTDSDSPVISTQAATTYSIISQILDRRRCLMWWVEVDEDTNQCVVKADSIVESPIVGNSLTIPANSNQINLRYDTDSLTNVVINSSGLQKVDQVVAQGPRVRCVGTYNYFHASIESAWTSANEATYEAGGGTHPAGTPQKRKEARNDAARRSPTLENVFSLFQIPEDWDQMLGATGSEYPAFVDDADELKQQNIPELTIEQSMPLLEGEDYSGSRIAAGLVATAIGTSEELRPFVLFKKPWITSAPYKYQNAEGTVALETTNPKENTKLSCHVSVPRNTRSIRVKVTGQPQHAIAYLDFTPISGEDKDVGQFTWEDAYFTFSVLSQDRPEGRYPETLTQGEVVRRKVIYAGDNFFRDYVAPGTVVGLDEDGEIIVSTGGHIPAKDSADDPVKLLQDIAEIAGNWYTVDHFVMSMESYRLKPSSDIPLGSLVLKAGGDPDVEGQYQEINAPVTQIAFLYPASGEVAKPSRMQIKTWAGELEAVEFVAVKTPATSIAVGSGRGL